MPSWRNGSYIDVTSHEGFEFIYGSMDRHEFRFVRIQTGSPSKSSRWFRLGRVPILAALFAAEPALSEVEGVGILIHSSLWAVGSKSPPVPAKNAVTEDWA